MSVMNRFLAGSANHCSPPLAAIWRGGMPLALSAVVLAFPLDALSQAGRGALNRGIDDVSDRSAPGRFVPPIIGLPPPGTGPMPTSTPPIGGNPQPGIGIPVMPALSPPPAGPVGVPTPGAGSTRIDPTAAPTVFIVPPPVTPQPTRVLAPTPTPVSTLPPRSEPAAISPPPPAAVIVVNPAPTPAPTIASSSGPVPVPTPVLVVVSPPPIVLLVTDTKTPTQGAGSSIEGGVVQGSGPWQPPTVTFAATSSTQTPLTNLVSAPLTPQNGNVRAAQGAVAADAGSTFGEILPGAQVLNESRYALPAPVQQNGNVGSVLAAANVAVKCQYISIRPDAQRKAVSLVDFTGDKLIVAAVPDAHINAVFQRAGYNLPDLAQAASWCVMPTVVRELLQPAQDPANQEASLLVQTGGDIRLMSREQWLAYQASIRPAAVASASNKTATPVKAGNRTNAKSGKQTAKPTFNLLRFNAVSGRANGLSPAS